MATYDFTVRAQDETGAFSDRDFSIQVRNNLVDRILAINSANAYASVDGTTWTERTGKGGYWCRNLLGKWLVCTDAYNGYDYYRSNLGTKYRLSDDTINWTEDLTFWISNDAPEYDEQGNETQPAGPLYHEYFYPTRDQFTVINGKIIIPSIVNGKMCIVYSTDAINWYAYESSQSSHTSNMMGISENTLVVGDVYASGRTAKNRHGISNVVLHNGKYTMLNNHTNNFYISENLIDWEVVEITNKNDLDQMNVLQTYDEGNDSFRDSFWSILSVNNVLWMMGNHNHHYDNGSTTTYRRSYAYNYVFYTTNLTDINYSSNYRNVLSRSDQGGTTGSTYVRGYYYPNASTTYDSMTQNTEHRQIYYANGVIFAYCGKSITSTKTLTDNTRQNLSTVNNREETITGSCFFEGDIYYTQIGTGTDYGVKKLTINANEYRTPSNVTGLPSSVIDITSV